MGERKKEIWFVRPELEVFDQINKGTMDEHIGLKVVEIGSDFVTGTLPVDNRTRQPYGLLHGGASVTLAESLGSLAGALCVDPAEWGVVGQSIFANHIRSVTSGLVYGTARPIHLGKRSQVWEIQVTDEAGSLVSISRLTLAVIPSPLKKKAED